MERSLVAVAVAALFSLAACGGSNSCQDAANANSACAGRLGFQGGFTAAQCNAGNCANKQKAIDCVVGIQCPADVNTYNNLFNACLTAAGCN